MGLYSGNYSRNMFNEENEYLRGLVQQGIPWLDADDNDHRMSVETQMRRITQMIGCGAIGDGFKITADGTSQLDFQVTGGDGTLDGAGRFLVNGYIPMLRDTVNYLNLGTSPSELSIFPQITDILYDADSNTTTLGDSAAKWTAAEHVGKIVFPDVASSSSFTVVSNTTNTMVLTGDATSSGGAAGTYYRIGLSTSGSRTDGVYLNVYVDEFGSAEDPNLEHQLAVPVEAQRRAKLIHTIYVKEGDGSYTDYVDLDGNQHYVYKLATITRNGSNLTDGHITDLRKTPVDSLDCSNSNYRFSNTSNLIVNGLFDQGCASTYGAGGTILDRTWNFMSTKDGSVSRPGIGDTEGFALLRIASAADNISQLYQTLTIPTAYAEKYPISISFNIRFLTLSTSTDYMSVTGIPAYSGRVLLGGNVYYLENSAVTVGQWKRITISFPETLTTQSPQLVFEFGPGVMVDLSTVSGVIGVVSALPELPSKQKAFQRCDTSVFYQDHPSTMWVVKHSMGTKIPVIHVWDTNGVSLQERYDRVVFVDENTLNIYFDTELSGKVVLTAHVCSGSPSSNVFIPGSNTTTTISIPGYEAYGISVVSNNITNELIEVNNFNLNLMNRTATLSITPAVPANNYTASVVSAVDFVYTAGSPLSTWSITHNLGTTDMILRCYDTTGEAIPGVATISSPNNITLSFPYPVAGYAVLKAHVKPDSGMEEATHTVPIWRVSTVIPSGSVTTSEGTLFSAEDMAGFSKNPLSSPFIGIADFEFQKGSDVYKFHATFHGILTPTAGTVSYCGSSFYGGLITTVTLDGTSVLGVANTVMEDVSGYLARLPEGTGSLFTVSLVVNPDGSVKFVVTSKVDWLHVQHIVSAILFGNHRPY